MNGTDAASVGTRAKMFKARWWRSPVEKFQHDVREAMKQMNRANNLGMTKTPYVPESEYDPDRRDGGQVTEVAYKLLRDAGYFGEGRKRG